VSSSTERHDKQMVELQLIASMPVVDIFAQFALPSMKTDLVYTECRTRGPV
jgi:hypothetical protein